MIVRRLLTITATVIVLLAVVSPATAQLQRDNPLTLEQSEETPLSSSFHTNELADARILDRLSRVLNDDDSIAFLESTSELAARHQLEQAEAADKKAAATTMKIDPILDDTGSFTAPKVDTEKFPVKPVIDATLVPDLPSLIEYTDHLETKLNQHAAPAASHASTSSSSSDSTDEPSASSFLEVDTELESELDSEYDPLAVPPSSPLTPSLASSAYPSSSSLPPASPTTLAYSHTPAGSGDPSLARQVHVHLSINAPKPKRSNSALHAMISRVNAKNQRAAKKMEEILHKLKSQNCRGSECIPQLHDKMEKWKADWVLETEETGGIVP